MEAEKAIEAFREIAKHGLSERALHQSLHSAGLRQRSPDDDASLIDRIDLKGCPRANVTAC
jgi:hypothetical protein